MIDMQLEVIILAGLIIFASHIVKGATGFANALIAIPLLSLFLDIKFVVPMFLLFDFPSSGMIVYQTRKHIQWRIVLLILPGLLVGTLIGAYLLISLATSVLRRMFGCLVMAFGFWLLCKSKPQLLVHMSQSIRKKLGFLSGLLGGITGGMFGMDGPIIVMYLSRLLKKTPFRATLTAIFLLSSFWRGTLYAYGGILSWDEVVFALVMVPFLIVGVITGSRFQERLAQQTFYKLVGLLLIMAGILLILY